MVHAVTTAAAGAQPGDLDLLIDGASGLALYMLEPSGSVRTWNRGAEQLHGWCASDVIGRAGTFCYPPEAAAIGKPEADLVHARTHGSYEDESWQVRKDGTEFLASVTISPLYDDGGALRGFAKMARDITDQTAARVALLRREHHLRSILASVPDAMIVFDENGIISSFSTAAERMFGYAGEEVVGRHVAMLIPQVHDGAKVPPGRVAVEQGVRIVVADPTPERASRKTGEIFPIEFVVGEADVAGERIFTGFIRDLAGRREAERRMRKLQSELIHVSRVSAMDAMASTLAHEINQPLTAVTNYLETLRAMIGATQGPLPNDSAELLDLAAAQALRAGAVVRRLRAFVEGGDAGIRREPLQTLIEEAASLGLVGAAEAGVVAATMITAAPAQVMVDRVQIQQVLVNLIRNAIQAVAAMPHKQLTLGAVNERPGWIRVTVADTGTGLDPCIRERLFEAFATTRRGGMGLGLSICRTIIEAHGGRIWAEDVPSGGTAFHFTIPLAEAADG